MRLVMAWLCAKGPLKDIRTRAAKAKNVCGVDVTGFDRVDVTFCGSTFFSSRPSCTTSRDTFIDRLWCHVLQLRREHFSLGRPNFQSTFSLLHFFHAFNASVLFLPNTVDRLDAVDDHGLATRVYFF